MQAYKLQGKIDSSGQLIISEAIDLPAGNVEIILLQPINSHNLSEPISNGTATSKTPRQVNCKIASVTTPVVDLSTGITRASQQDQLLL